VLTRTPLTERVSAAELRRRAGNDQVPLFLLQNGYVHLLSDGGPVPEAGATLVSLAAPPEEEEATE
jgi:hypothetical protein